MAIDELEAKKAYHREQSRAWYKANKARHLANVLRNNAAYRDRNYTWLYEYLSDKVCVDCGESDLVVFELDHLENKVQAVAQMCSDGVGLDLIQKEVEKCEVVCANCHRRRTAKRGNWKRHNFASMV